MKFSKFIFCFILFSSLTLSVYAQDQNPDSLDYNYREIFIPMNDGVKLATDVFSPKNDEKFPCILVRTPYNKAGVKGGAEWFVKKDIIVLVQDCRGKFKSEGVFYPFVNERKDGLQTLRWIRKQPWSNGKIGGWGGSYVGYTQWAISDSLNALVPNMTGADLYELIYPGGLFSLQTAFNWGLVVDSKTVNAIPPEKILKSFWILPLSVADDSTIKDIPFINDWLTHSTNDLYWQQMNHQRKINAPVFSIAGWYDIFLTSQIEDFQAISREGHPDNRIIIGPWCHGSQGHKNEYGGSERTGRRNQAARGFLLHHLCNNNENYLALPYFDTKYNLFIMERNEYFGSDEYPPKEMKPTNYYFGPDLYLKTENYSTSGFLHYAYDPKNPYPSKGGTSLGAGVGPSLQNDNTSRKDQVVFETDTLQKPLVLLGPITASLFVSSTAPCTDFIVCLQDVFPDSNIINIQEGGTSVKLVDEAPEHITFSVWATGYQLNPGHKLKVVITSSWFPRFNRNINSCEPIASATKKKKAIQNIYYGQDAASYITLPIVDIQ
jgi:uncharacterized protein